jgi:hypothetical protein
VFLFGCSAPAGHGGEGSGGWRWLVAGVGGHGWCGGGWKMGEAGSSCCGRARSSRLGFVAGRRTATAVIYNVWRRHLPGGWRYGDSGIV